MLAEGEWSIISPPSVLDSESIDRPALLSSSANKGVNEQSVDTGVTASH